MIEREYAVIYERISGGGWSAYVPDLPGIGVGADTRPETEKLVREGIRIYIEELRSLGEPIPEPNSYIETIRISA